MWPPMWIAENRARYKRDHLRYPSDLTDEEWGLIEPLIPPAKKGGGTEEKTWADSHAQFGGHMPPVLERHASEVEALINETPDATLEEIPVSETVGLQQ